MIGPVHSHNLRQQATKEAHNLIHRATNKMLIEVGRMLLENRAASCYIRTIHLEFIQYARDLMSESRIQELPDLQLITSRCILSERFSLLHFKGMSNVCTGCKNMIMWDTVEKRY